MYNVPVTAGGLEQEKEYYLNRILHYFPERSEDPNLVYADAKLEYLRMINDGLIPDVEDVASTAVEELLPDAIAKADIPGQVVKTVAASKTVTEAAAAAINGNPKIEQIETSIELGRYSRRELVAGDDLNTIRTPGVYTCPNTIVAAALINWPAGSFTGSLIVSKSVSGNFTTQDVHALVSTIAPPEHYSRVTRTATDGFTPWGNPTWVRGILPNETNLDTFVEAGVWSHTNIATAKLVGLPSEVITGAITLENFITPKTGISLSRLTTEDGRVFTRTKKILAGWANIPWKPVGIVSAPVAPSPTIAANDSGLANSVLMQDWSRRMGGRKKVATATVALRFDHGLSNFNDKIRAELDARNFKYSLALCSGQWNRAENLGITPDMVNAWVIAGRAEIWNHSKDHGSGDNSETAWKAAIIDGLTELRAQLPAAQIDGFAPPGSTGTDFGGFTTGKTLEEFYNTDGGRFILQNHAVVAGYIGASSRWQDGTPRQGLGHYTLDSYTLAQVKTIVSSAQASKRAIQFMLHPSLVDNGTNITTETFISMLDYFKAEETAGRLKIVGPYEQLLTDAV